MLAETARPRKLHLREAVWKVEKEANRAAETPHILDQAGASTLAVKGKGVLKKRRNARMSFKKQSL